MVVGVIVVVDLFIATLVRSRREVLIKKEINEKLSNNQGTHYIPLTSTPSPFSKIACQFC